MTTAELPPTCPHCSAELPDLSAAATQARRRTIRTLQERVARRDREILALRAEVARLRRG